MEARDAMAEMMHILWSRWTSHMIDKWSPEFVKRWQRQICTSYEYLSEREKESDRDCADQILNLPAEGWIVPETCMGRTMPSICHELCACANCDEWKPSRIPSIAEVLAGQGVLV